MIRATVLAGLLFAPAMVRANDGFGGLSATGLTFGQTDAVAMAAEDLVIGIDHIRVAYVFRNTTAADVTGEVIFPLPPIPLSGMMDSAWNLPEDRTRDNLVAFTATVDGMPVPVQIDRIAVIEPPWQEGQPLSAQYDSPGRDVTADLARLGIPLSVDPDALTAQVLGMTPAQQAEVAAAGLAEFVAYGTGAADYVNLNWSVILRYHWTQTFPAGAMVRIVHDYENRPSGGLFGWEDPPTADYMQDYAARYCVDAGTSRAMVKALAHTDATGETYSMGSSWNIDYVLRTANSWAGPVGTFRLTLDKGNVANVISLCADGIKKVGPTTFVLEKTNFTPDRDLQILVVGPMDQ